MRMNAFEVTDRANVRNSRLLEAGAGRREPIVITTGANLARVRGTAMMMHGRSDVVLAMTGRDRIRRRETAITILRRSSVPVPKTSLGFGVGNFLRAQPVPERILSELPVCRDTDRNAGDDGRLSIRQRGPICASI